MQLSGYQRVARAAKNCAIIIKELKELIENPNFKEKHKKNAKDFIRDRVLTFKMVILFLISDIKDGIQSELGDFFSAIERSDTKEHKVSNSGFTQARAKLKYSAFIEMDSLQTDLFYENTDYKTWKDFRLIAIDGSTLYLPSSAETQAEFGVSEVKENGQKIVLARISEAFDPLNHIILDAVISPFVVSEHEMMIQHLDRFGVGDLCLYDKNYPGFWIYKMHQRKRIDFCMKVQTKSKGKFIEDFVESGELERVVNVKCTTKEARAKCVELGLDTEPVPCRLIRIERMNGEVEVFITSLLDTELFTYDCFKALYHLRWPVEEDFKLLKHRIELGNFSGKTADAIYQDFHAKIFMANLTSVLAYDSELEIEESKKDCKYDYKINWSNATQNIKKTGFLLFIRSSITNIISKLHKLFMINPIPHMPYRYVARSKSNKKRHYSICYK